MSSWFNFSPRSVDSYLRDESGTYEEGGRRSISTRQQQQRTTWKSGNGSESEVFYSPTAADSSSAAIRGSAGCRADDSYRSWSSAAAAEERGSNANLGLRSSAAQQQQQTTITSAASSSSSSSSSSSIFEVQTFWASGSTLCGLSPSILSPRRVTKFQPIQGSRRLLDHHHHHHQPHPSNMLSLEIDVKMPSTFQGTLSISTEDRPSLLGRHVLHPTPLSATTASASASAAGGPGPLHHHRRESFLYRATSENSNSAGSEDSQSPKPWIPSSQNNSREQSHSDDVIVTPFAQILQTLRRVRNNYMIIANLPSTCSRSRRLSLDRDDTCRSIQPSKTVPLSEDQRRQLAIITLDDLEWSLEQLENIQIHKSVSDLATNKFRRLLSRELNQFAESTKSGSQVSEYICNTFLDIQNDVELLPVFRSEDDVTAAAQRVATPVEDHCKQISTITGIRGSNPDVTSYLATNIPMYGIKVKEESELAKVMVGINTWGVDIFRIKELSNNRPLTCLTYTILKERNLLAEFNIPEVTLVNYLTQLERHYRSDVSYHNSVHAADVMQSSHYLVSVPALQDVFTQLEVLAVIYGAAIHDVDHPGLTNQYLVNSNAELAIMYNDVSVLENHHLALAFKLLQSDGCDIFCNLPTKTRQTLRRMVIDVVLATDMSKHMSLLADLKTMVETKTLAGSDVIQLNDYNDRIMVLQNLVHCSDLSNPTKPLPIYRQWTDRIMEEFFRQGDLEKELGLEVSPMCDRLTATVEKSQIGFMNYIVHPLWETWADLVYPDCQVILDTLEENRQWYQLQIDPPTTPTSAQPPEAENSDRRPDAIPEVVTAETEVVMAPTIELQRVVSEVFVEETLPLTLQSPTPPSECTTPTPSDA